MLNEKQKNKEYMELLKTNMRPIPKIGELVEGTVISISKSEVQLDIEGLTAGIVRGKELEDESGEYSNLEVGDKVQATLIDMENELGVMELSFLFAGHKKAWDKMEDLLRANKIVQVKIISANKGGLIVKLDRVSGFLPVSQLTVEHYPRVEGGDKNKILEKLNSYTNQMFDVKVIDVNEKESKLIVSEKAAWEDKQSQVLEKYKVGDTVEGTISGVVDFGAFVEFDDGLEGLIHISELAWKRISHPNDIVKVGDKIAAQIITIQGSKISLSIKRLEEDPWKDIEERYKLNDIVKATVTKINPFGLFVELEKNIHGLAHISELADKPIASPNDVAKIGDQLDFRIVSLEPAKHRLGLSLKLKPEPIEEKPAETEAAPAEEKEEPKAKDAEEQPKEEEKA